MFLATGSVFTDAGFNSTININATDITEGETATGVFDVLPDLARFIGFVGFGIGIPGDVPEFFQLLFTLFQTTITLLSIGWVVSSIWDG